MINADDYPTMCKCVAVFCVPFWIMLSRKFFKWMKYSCHTCNSCCRSRSLL